MTPKVIAAAFRGIAEVVQLEGQNVRACRGPGSILLMPQHGIAACTRCEAAEAIPDPPASMSLLAPGTNAHALYIASWLHKLAKAHETCGA